VKTRHFAAILSAVVAVTAIAAVLATTLTASESRTGSFAGPPSQFSLQEIALPHTKPVGSNPSGFVRLGRYVLFDATDAAHGRQLWSWDILRAKARMITDALPIHPGFRYVYGTFSEKDQAVSPAFTTRIGDRAFFMIGGELWRTDGTEAGTKLVRRLTHDDVGIFVSMVDIRGHLLCLVSSTPHVDTLWISNGTHSGTRVLLRMKSRWDNPTLTVAAGRAYFIAYTTRTGNQLWSTDCTRHGTHLVKAVVPRGSGEDIGSVVAAGTNLYFIAQLPSTDSNNFNQPGPSELWWSNGTAKGMRLLRTFPGAYSNSPYPSDLTTIGRSLLFVSVGPTGDEALWKSNSTATGTTMIREFARAKSGYGGVTVGNLTLLGRVRNGRRQILFVVGRRRLQLWRTDGTTSGSRFMSALGPRSRYGFRRALIDSQITVVRAGSHPEAMLDVGDGWLEGWTGQSPMPPYGRLWVTNGTVHGTHKLRANQSDAQLADAGAMTPAGTQTSPQVLLSAVDPGYGLQPWISDGTNSGTHIVQAINAGPAPVYLNSIHATPNGVLVNTSGPPIPQDRFAYDFAASAAPMDSGKMDNFARWVYPGKFGDYSGPYRTILVRPGHPAKTVSEPGKLDAQYGLTNLGSRLVFLTRARRGAGVRLWGSPSTSRRAHMLAKSPAHVSSNSAIVLSIGFRAYALLGNALYVTDGTGRGTHLIKTFPNLETGVYNTLALVRDRLYVVTAGHRGSTGQFDGGALWQSDGTAYGTHIVKAFPKGSSAPLNLRAWRGRVYFATRTRTGRKSLWATDPSEHTARLLVKLPSKGSAPFSLTPVGSRLFFVTWTNAKKTWNPASRSSATTLWVTNGTTAGTKSVKHFRFGHTSGGSLRSGIGLFDHAGEPFWCCQTSPSPPQSLTALGNKLVFLGWNGKTNYRLWVSDGTARGTHLLATGNAPRIPAAEGLARLAGNLYFAGYTRAAGTELWTTNGTAGGTNMVSNIGRGIEGSYPANITATGGKLYFRTAAANLPYSAQSQSDLWVLSPS
jgi:ELWxxDGT repeat protein